jgi:hypothetical protein
LLNPRRRLRRAALWRLENLLNRQAGKASPHLLSAIYRCYSRCRAGLGLGEAAPALAHAFYHLKTFAVLLD